MGRIINFYSKKNNDDTTSDDKVVAWTYKDRIRSHKMVIMYRTLLVLILVAAMVAVFVYQAKTKVYTICEVAQTAENHSIRTENMIEFAGTILSYGMDGAACVDSTGNALWNVTYEMQNPMVSVQNDIIAIGDYGSRTVYMMNTSGSIGEITTTMPIYKFCVSEAGEIALILNDTDITWIYLYDTMGNILAYFKTTMRQSGFPVDISISPNGKIVGVSFVYVDSGEMRSSIAYYNFGDVGQNETDNYVSGYDYSGTVIPTIRFMDNETAFAVSDDRIMFYKGSEKPVSQAEHLVADEIQKVFYDDKYVTLVYYSDQADYRYRLEIYNRNGSLVDEINCNMEFRDIIMDDDVLYIYSESRIMIVNVNGNVRFEGALPRSTYLMIPGKSVNKFTTVNSETVDNMVLR